MINLSNDDDLTLAAGQSITFDLVPLKTGRCEYHRAGSAVVSLNGCGNIFEIDFSANIGATAPGVAQLSIMLDGEALVEGTMISTTAAAGDLNNVAKPGIRVRNVNCTSSRVSVQNTGTTEITVGKGSLLSIKRVA